MKPKRRVRLPFLLTAVGLFLTATGSVLVSQRLGTVGQPIRVVGLLTTLIALSCVLGISIVQRQPFAEGSLDLRSRPRGGPVILAARVLAGTMVLLGLATFCGIILQLGALLAQGGWAIAYGLSYALVASLTTTGCGVALWLLADISGQLKQLLGERNRDAETEQSGGA